MKNQWQLGLVSLFFTTQAVAQIIPDATVGTSLTPDVTIKGIISDRINGGTIQGTNLFHSFTEFNLGAGRGVYFTNPDDVSNILTRVTGTNPSNINGKLGVLGNANLFFLNPNGVLFGTGASLDLQGSFLATTANGIGLANGDIFSTNTASPLPSQILNVNPNVLLFNQIATQGITNRSTANGRGLQVPAGRSLLLAGGDIALEGGRLQSSGGRIELGGRLEN